MQALPLAVLQIQETRASKEAGGTGKQDCAPHKIVSVPSENNSASAHPHNNLHTSAKGSSHK